MLESRSDHFKRIIKSLIPAYWYAGYDQESGRHMDDIIFDAHVTLEKDSIFTEFPKYLAYIVDAGKFNKKIAEVIKSRFGLFTFNYDTILRTKYYDTYFYAAALAQSKSTKMVYLDTLMERYADVPEVIMPEMKKKELSHYIDTIKLTAQIEENNLEILRKYYASKNNIKDLRTEVEKEKAYNTLSTLMLKEEAFNLLTEYVIGELQSSCDVYRIGLYDVIPEGTDKSNKGTKDNN
jgi:hypothetical protein